MLCFTCLPTSAQTGPTDEAINSSGAKAREKVSRCNPLDRLERAFKLARRQTTANRKLIDQTNPQTPVCKEVKNHQLLLKIHRATAAAKRRYEPGTIERLNAEERLGVAHLKLKR